MENSTPPNPWRYRCPNGHAAYRRVGDEYECKTCSIRFDPDELVDMTETDVSTSDFADRR